MIRVKSIDHVCLWVKSLPDSKVYYEKLFGVVCTPRKDDETTLVVETDTIHFFMSETNDSDFLSKQHLSFEVESLDSVINKLKDMGVSDFEQGEVTFFKHRNYKWCEWRDPSGIRLECVEIL